MLRSRSVRSILLALVACAAAPPLARAVPPDPATFVGRRIGDDGFLVKYPRIVEYFELLAHETDRVRVIELGRTTEGNRMIAAAISSPANQVVAAPPNIRAPLELRTAPAIRAPLSPWASFLST